MAEDRDRPLRELQEELSELNALREHRGYKTLMTIADLQAKARMDSLIAPIKTMDDTLEQEFRKGEIGGIQLFMRMTDVQISMLESEIETLLKIAES
jgi:hypothetical protein